MAPSKSQPVIKSKRVRPTLLPEQKKARQLKAALLTSDVTSAREDYLKLAKIIAEKHNRSVPWASRALFLGGRLLRKKRAASAWNAFVRRELKVINDDLPVGSRHKLPVFMADNRESLLASYATLNKEERQDLLDELIAVRAERETVQRTSPKAMQKDVDATFASMTEEFQAVAERTGVKGFFLAVRSDIEHHHQPKMFFSEEARGFFQQCLGLNPDRVALQFEAWIVAGPDKVVPPKYSIAQVISECRSMIQESLATILMEHGIHDKPRMNYKNYEKRVVEEWGVVLKGWTGEKIVNPGNLGGRQMIRDLLEALKSKACKWEKLTEEELVARIADNHAREAAGEHVYKRRKKAAGQSGRAGTGSAKTPKSSEIVDDEDDEMSE